MASKRLVLCIGDSHTHGTAGSSFVQRLAHHHKHLQFVASGVNGEPSESMAKRLPKVLQQYPKPAAVVIMVGSNDCIEQESWVLHWFYKLLFRISQRATKEPFVKNVSSMVETVKFTCPDAKVIVMTCPPLTEQPQHPAFIRTTQYNADLKAHISKTYVDVGVADLHGRCVQFLQDNSHRSKQLQLPPASFSVPSVLMCQCSAVFRHYLFGQSWDSISRSRQLMLLTDQVHINDTAAELVVGVLQPLLHGL